MPRPLAVLLALTLALSPAESPAADTTQPKTELHLRFDGDTSEPEWSAQNDNVMGGISKGGATIQDGALVFTGSLSLENNGGFAQVRIQKLDRDLSAKKLMKLRVMGDGRTYQLRVATDARYRGSRISYYAPFATKAGEWTEVAVPFADLKPSHHGDDLDGPPLNLARVEELSMLIGDKLEGPFALKVDWMRAE